jgi:hypothetical protein
MGGGGADGGAAGATGEALEDKAPDEACPPCMERCTIRGTWSPWSNGATYLTASLWRQWPSSSNMANRVASGMGAHALRFT